MSTISLKRTNIKEKQEIFIKKLDKLQEHKSINIVLYPHILPYNNGKQSVVTLL